MLDSNPDLTLTYLLAYFNVRFVYAESISLATLYLRVVRSYALRALFLTLARGVPYLYSSSYITFFSSLRSY
jgi:hypothetical protein